MTTQGCRRQLQLKQAWFQYTALTRPNYCTCVVLHMACKVIMTLQFTTMICFHSYAHTIVIMQRVGQVLLCMNMCLHAILAP